MHLARGESELMSSCPQSWHVVADWTSSSKQCYALSVATET
ncbi:hypothetical protein ACFPRL_10910 [Pseudoclavibacter helvolus]